MALVDAEVDALVRAERARRRGALQLLAGENLASAGVRGALGSEFGDKYAEGYPGRRHHTGCGVADELEELAARRARELFHAEHANVQPYSGTLAMLAAYAALLRPGDGILAMALADGGHLTGGSAANFSGRWFRAGEGYRVREKDGRIDMDEVRALALRQRPKVIVAGGISYPRAIDWAAFRAVADEAGAALLADVSQITGLIAAGVLESPVPYAHVVCATTHKLLRGPRGGLLLCATGLAERVDRAVFPFVQGGPSLNEVAAKAVAFGEAATPEYRAYAERTVENAHALAVALSGHGIRPLTGGTDTHLVTADLRGLGITGREAELRAERAGILVGRCAVPHDPAPPSAAAGIRMGTGCVTTQGMTPDRMPRVAELLAAALADADGSRARDLAAAAAELAAPTSAD
ncbi:serine hydroxymethyltransferase [Phaeacidiphilus oryzae]|uniref:serine hydroxymethyltransferase n=1 Tax=Phaeacidiphilus oryzae TaxID=348818 RepID=UPI0005693351|nr:serine hydroxymethyltransferase [Phaeacidiphilus oryzae]